MHSRIQSVPLTQTSSSSVNQAAWHRSRVLPYLDLRQWLDTNENSELRESVKDAAIADVLGIDPKQLADTTKKHAEELSDPLSWTFMHLAETAVSSFREPARRRRQKTSLCLVEASSSYAVADEYVAKRIMRGARTRCADVLASEIVAVIHLKAPEIVRSRSVRNPLGLLTHAIPLCFEGSGTIRLRKAWEAEREREVLRQAEKEERDREMKQWMERQISEWKEVLANPAAADKERESAKRHILQFGPEIPEHEG